MNDDDRRAMSIPLAASYEVAREAMIPCVADQWNIGRPQDEPWVHDDGTCSVCAQMVEYVRIEPPRPHAFTAKAVPHLRPMRWHVLAADELQGLLDYRELW